MLCCCAFECRELAGCQRSWARAGVAGPVSYHRSATTALFSSPRNVLELAGGARVPAGLLEQATMRKPPRRIGSAWRGSDPCVDPRQEVADARRHGCQRGGDKDLARVAQGWRCVTTGAARTGARSSPVTVPLVGQPRARCHLAALHLISGLWSRARSRLLSR
jgi:hypothetical protein